MADNQNQVGGENIPKDPPPVAPGTIIFSVPNITTNGLTALHDTIRKSLEIDDSASSEQEKPFQVRKTPDWRQMSDALEAELDKRQMKYTKIPW